MISLNGTPLPAGMLWENEWELPRRGVESYRTVTGDEVQHFRPSGGRVFELVSSGTSGWFTRQQADWMKGLATENGAVHLLAIRGETVRVRFLSEEAHAVSFRAVVPKAEYTDADKFIGRIRLKEVE